MDTDLDNLIENLTNFKSEDSNIDQALKNTLSSLFANRYDECLDVISKYRDHWEKTKTFNPCGPNTDVLDRTFELIFNLIVVDIIKLRQEYLSQIKSQD